MKGRTFNLILIYIYKWKRKDECIDVMSPKMVLHDLTAEKKIEKESKKKKEEERWLIRHITSPPPKGERATTTYDSSHLSGRCNRRNDPRWSPIVDPTYSLRCCWLWMWSPHERKLHVAPCGDSSTPPFISFRSHAG